MCDKKKEKKGTPSGNPGPALECPRPVNRLAHQLPQSREAKLGDVPSRLLGEAAKDSRPVTLPRRRGLPSCSGLYRPLPGMPRAPRARTLTDAGSPGSGSAVAAARPGTAPAFREPRRASERARGERGSGRVRGQTDGPFLAVGGKRGSETRAGCRARAGAGVGLRGSRPRWTWYSPRHGASNGAGERGGADAPYK